MGVYLLAGAVLAGQWLAGAAAEPAAVVLTTTAAGITAVACWRVRWVRIPAVAATVLVAPVSAHLAARAARPPDDVSHVVRLLSAGERSPGRMRVEGALREVRRTRSGGLRMVVDVAGVEDVHEAASENPLGRQSMTGAVLLFVRHVRHPWEAGQRVAFAARLRRIGNFGNPGEFDWAGWNARRGLFVSAFVWDDDDIEALADGPAPPWHVRARTVVTRAILEQRPAGEPARGRALVAALVTGERGALSADAARAIRDAGLSHVLAISGLHMGLVAGAVLWMVTRAAVRTRWVRAGIDQYRPAAFAAGAAVLSYAAVSGGGVSVARAVVMASVALAALWSGRPSRASRALAWAAVIVSFAMPGAIHEVGFQLSFTAVAALLLYVGRPRPFADGPRALSWACQALAATTLAWWVTAPLVAQHFYRISLVAPVVNVAAALPVAATTLSGLAGASLVALWPPASQPVFSLGALAAELLLRIAELGAAMPGAGLHVPAPGWPLAVVLVLLPFAWALRPPLAMRAFLALCACAVVLVVQAAHARFRADRMEVVFVAVGQGDATVARLPGGEVLVVDAGTRGRARITLAPLLRRMRVGHIDYLVASHVQSDHWGGLPELAADFSIGELWHGGGRCAVGDFSAFVAALEQAGVEVVDVGTSYERSGRGPRRHGKKGGQRWLLEALWPRSAEGDCSDNDRSVVLAVRSLGRAVLLTGDIEAAAESRLAAGGAVHADVLKAPHHGSRTSSTPAFVAAVAPLAVVASVGAGNRYGFPHADVVERYREAGASFLRTDIDGAVIVRVDGTGATLQAAKRR